MRGNLTVGRYFVFERNGHALANTGGNSITVMATTPQHELPAQHWVLQQNKAFGTAFKMYSVVDKKYVENVDIVFLGGGKGYSLFSTGQFCKYWGEFPLISKEFQCTTRTSDFEAS